MTVFLVVVLIGLVILAIALLVGSDSPDPDGGIGAAIALVPICLIGFVVLVMLAFEDFLVFLIVFAVIAAIGGLFLYFVSLIGSAPPSLDEREESLERTIGWTESFVDQLIDEVLSRGYYISVLVENSGDLPGYQGNGMVVSRSNDSAEIRRALGKNEREDLRVTKDPESDGGPDDLVGEIYLAYLATDDHDSKPHIEWTINDESLDDSIESIYESNYL